MHEKFPSIGGGRNSGDSASMPGTGDAKTEPCPKTRHNKNKYIFFIVFLLPVF
jgi:hypothetical protein